MKNIVITGCGSGLGKALYETSANKHVVFPHYRTGEFGLVGDITDYDFPCKLAEYLERVNADVFINSAAIYCGGSLEETSDEEIERTILTNLTSQIIMLKRVFSYFKKKNGGTIININSLSGIYPSKRTKLYTLQLNLDSKDFLSPYR